MTIHAAYLLEKYGTRVAVARALVLNLISRFDEPAAAELVTGPLIAAAAAQIDLERKCSTP